eukprot:5575705-Lingulodinium_polyedra.AAC.1
MPDIKMRNPAPIHSMQAPRCPLAQASRKPKAAQKSKRTQKRVARALGLLPYTVASGSST